MREWRLRPGHLFSELTADLDAAILEAEACVVFTCLLLPSYGALGFQTTRKSGRVDFDTNPDPPDVAESTAQVGGGRRGRKRVEVDPVRSGWVVSLLGINCVN